MNSNCMQNACACVHHIQSERLIKSRLYCTVLLNGLTHNYRTQNYYMYEIKILQQTVQLDIYHNLASVAFATYIVDQTGLEKTQVLLKTPAGRLNAGFFTGFSGKTGFLKQSFTENVHFWGSISVTTQLLSMQHALLLLESQISGD
jgi:hypothetical protein